MLKWFAAVPGGRGGGASPPLEVVTDDPLATITLSLPRVSGRRHPQGRREKPRKGAGSRPREIYAVSRVNPIFEDEEGSVVGPALTPTTSSPDSGRRESSVAAPESPGKSASSGYESNPTDRTSSSEFSDDVAPSGASPRTRRAFLVEAGGGGSPPRVSLARRNSRKRAAPELLENMAATIPHHVALSTIPEGQIPKESAITTFIPVAYCIPAPIWPGTFEVEVESTTAAAAADTLQQRASTIVDLAALQTGSQHAGITTALSRNLLLTTASRRAVLLHEDRLLPLPPPRPPEQQNLSTLTTNVVTSTNRRHQQQQQQQQQRLRGINSVKDLWDKSGMKVNGSRRLLVESDDEDSLERSSNNSSDNNNRHCDLPTSNCPMPPAQTIDPPPPPPPPLPPQRCASSSSSSGYSEISLNTPPRRSVSPPTVHPSCHLPPVFLHSDMSQVSNSVRNAMIYGTLCRIKCASGVSAVGASYEKLLGIHRTFENRLVDKNTSKNNKNVIESPNSSWESFPDVSNTPVKTTNFDKTAKYYPPSQRPDFTLDIPGAERLLRKINAAKRQRCWCRITVSFLGLVFFLLSVMAVSMLYTRGRRLFGSL